MVLYRKYRPQSLAEIVGQDQIKKPLLAQLESGNISHAYLFTGPAGTGKTSVARILAKAVNCEKSDSNKTGIYGEPCGKCEVCEAITKGSHLDLIEIDAASNRGIDEIRDLREKIKLSPAGSRFKVYIIDEAHMLTTEAFNALLKTLEEPPAHALFVLATTEPQKIPATIISRTSRYDFKLPTLAEVKEKLSTIAKNEGWKISGDSLEEIAKLAQGAFRNAEVLLEKVASVNSAATKEEINEILGKKEGRTWFNFLNFLEKGQTKEALVWLEDYLKNGGSVRLMTESVLETLRKALLFKAGVTMVDSLSEEEAKGLESLGKSPRERILTLIDLFNKAIESLREATIPSLPLEIAIIEATLDRTSEVVPKIDMERAEKTEEKLEEKAEAVVTKAQEIIEQEAEKTNGQTKAKKKLPEEEKLLKLVRSKWSVILKEAKKVSTFLESSLKNVKPVDVDEELLILEINNHFHKGTLESQKYRSAIEDILKKVTGHELRFKGIRGGPPPEAKNTENLKSKEDIDPVEVFGKLD